MSAAAPFGRYRLIERIGQGGMAVVHRARIDGPAGFSRELVIKRMLPALCRDPGFVNMLIAEARLSARLHHPGIVQVHELGQVGDEYYLAMELVDGYDLAMVMRRAIALGVALPIGLACYIAHEIAAALGYAHALCDDGGAPLSIVHRDVSPANVMLARIGQVKLLDFGIAKAIGSVRDEETRTGTLKGKLSYMSPEQAEADPVDRRADIFALGVVLWECLTMRRLFGGHDDLRTLKLVREANVAPPSQLRADLPPELDAIVLRMLARSPADRYATCDEVVAALAPLLRRYDASGRALREFLEAIEPIRPSAPRVQETSTAATVRLAPPSAAAEPLGSPATGASAPALRAPTDVMPPRRRRRASWPLVVALVPLAAVTLWRLQARSRPAAAPLPQRLEPPVAAPASPPMTRTAAPPTSPAPAATPPSTPPPVRVRVVGTPGASVTLDGAAVGTIPVDVILPATANARTLVVHARGYRPFRQEIAGDAPAEVTAVLQRLRPAARAGKRSDDGLKDPFAR